MENTTKRMSVLANYAFQNQGFLTLLDRLYIYSAPNTTEVNEYGKPIRDKWTLHRIIAEIRGILMFILNDERIVFLSILILILYYTIASLIYYLQIGDEHDYLNI